MQVAIIQMHDHNEWRAIALPEGQSKEFDEGSAMRRWLWPYLGKDWHLLKIVDVETAPPDPALLE